MNIDTRAPEVVRRAMARLNESKGPKSDPKALNEERDRRLPTLAFSAAAPSAAADQGDTSDDGRVVNVSPTSLAANGISLPSAGAARTVEEFRSIKRQVLANAARASANGSNDLSRVVMITSARPGDGKTYTAINLALSIAFERDLKVLLVDADVYRQSLLAYLGIEATAGWIDLLADAKLSFKDILLHTNIPNLSILPAGHAHPEVPELMSSHKMAELVNEMARRYPDRFIIFDTLPCLASSEPTVLAGMVGQTLFVVAAHETRRDQVESSLRLISACPSVSLILNKATPILAEQFGGNPYGYGYKDSK